MESVNNNEIRPWGSFEILFENENCKIKRIEVNPGGRLSYQYHKKRSEAWTIIEGYAKITINEKEIKYKKGDTITIPKGSKHRIENYSKQNLVFIEVDDIIRLNDDYGRK